VIPSNRHSNKIHKTEKIKKSLNNILTKNDTSGVKHMITRLMHFSPSNPGESEMILTQFIKCCSMGEAILHIESTTMAGIFRSNSSNNPIFDHFYVKISGLL
jgi:hypothetical protein